MDADRKRCPTCGVTKDRGEFSRHASKADGLQSRCKACVREYYAANRREYMREYWAANRERKREYDREYKAANRERIAERQREYDLARYHGITTDEYDALLEAQGGGCGICGTKEPGGSGRFHVDHDHGVTGEYASGPDTIRGLLCHNCNVGLGHFQDSIPILLAAATYVQRGGSRFEPSERAA